MSQCQRCYMDSIRNGALDQTPISGSKLCKNPQRERGQTDSRNDSPRSV